MDLELKAENEVFPNGNSAAGGGEGVDGVSRVTFSRWKGPAELYRSLRKVKHWARGADVNADLISRSLFSNKQKRSSRHQTQNT